MDFNLGILKGNIVTLESIGVEHLEELQSAASDPEIWRFIPFALNDPPMMGLFVSHVATLPEKGEGQAYAIRHNKSNKVIGGSGYWHIDHQHRKLEIGGSWLMGSYQKSGANTEAKYLLLANALKHLPVKEWVLASIFATRNL